MSEGRIIFALDAPDGAGALAWVDQLSESIDFFKIGLELFTAEGPPIVSAIKGRDLKVFLDLKFHDIPNTVAGAVRSACRLGADVINVHAGGGPKMLEAAARAAAEFDRTKVIGVTVLTSMDDQELAKVGVSSSPAAQAGALAKLCSDCGLDGVVCSPKEAAAIRKSFGPDFLIITPGVRPSFASVNDQKRVATPAEAIKSGADYLVIGRPISAADNPTEAAEKINIEIKDAIGGQ